MRRAAVLFPLLVLLCAPAVAGAQQPVRVQGTTDTTDSGLIQDVIQPGFEGSFVVLDRDVFTVPPRDIGRVQVRETWLRGERVFRR